MKTTFLERAEKRTKWRKKPIEEVLLHETSSRIESITYITNGKTYQYQEWVRDNNYWNIIQISY